MAVRTLLTAVLAGVLGSAAAALTLGLWPSPALAAEVTEVATAFDDAPIVDARVGRGFLFRLQLGYELERHTAAIKREVESAKALVPGVLETFKDLRYASMRHIIDLRAEIGLFHNLSFHVGLPIIVADTRSLSFDQDSDSPCVFPPEPDPTCVNAQNSTTVRDGLLPPTGFDAENAGQGFAADQATIFRGPRRSGVDQLHLGITWAPLHQRRDDTKPIWTLGFEARVAVGNEMTFDRANPAANTSVGRGVDEFRFTTAFSHRFRYLDPYMSLYYQLAKGRASSLFKDYGRGQTVVDPPQQAGLLFGFEAIPWEKPAKQQRLSIDIAGQFHAIFRGRDYSEVWEMLASSPPLTKAMEEGGKPEAFSGITDVQNYASVGFRAGIGLRLGRYAKLRTSFGLTYQTPHFLTSADAGKDKNGNHIVDPTIPDEVNPLYRQLIDLPGHRYKADESLTFRFFLSGEFLY
jgi:hypothetical protein